MIIRFVYRTFIVFSSLQTWWILSPLPNVVILVALILGDDEPTIWHQGVTGTRLIILVCPCYGTICAIRLHDMEHFWHYPFDIVCLALSVSSFRR